MNETAFDRLKRWRDVGDGPATYCAGDGNFGSDVKHLLDEVERLTRVLKRECDLTVDLRAEIERMRVAAAAVCWFDWSGNDDDAVAAIDNLRRLLFFPSHGVANE